MVKDGIIKGIRFETNCLNSSVKKCTTKISEILCGESTGSLIIKTDAFDIHDANEISASGDVWTNFSSNNRFASLSSVFNYVPTNLYRTTNEDTGTKSIIFALNCGMNEKPIKLAEVELPQNLIPEATAPNQ